MQMFPKSRAGAVKLATPLMILCFLAMAGFLYWLSTYAATEPDEVVAGEDGEALNEVSFQEFAVGTQAYMGEEITLRGVGVTATIGTRFFWTNITADDLYLLAISDAAMADSVDVSSLRRVDVTGTVMALTDSVIAAWDEAGAFANEGDRFQVEFAEDKGDYFEIMRFEIEDEGDESDEPGESDDEDPAESGDPPS